MNKTQKSNRPRGFTLVELLVVIAIIGILIALLLPAVQAAREAARRIQCGNQVSQMAKACLLHENAQGHLPTTGWSYQYIGDPDRGVGKAQPGGWVYNTLPYLEQMPIHELGRGLSLSEKIPVLATQMRTPMPMQNCPSRRSAEGYAWYAASGYTLINVTTPADGELVARTDYAGNGGDRRGPDTRPTSYAAGDNEATWANTDAFDWTGIFYPRSMIKISEVADGASHTFLIGEKSLMPEHYENGQNSGDNQSMYQGYDVDTIRFVATSASDADLLLPRGDTPGVNYYVAFGSAHPSACNFAMVDGSMQVISYDVDPSVYRRLGHREDGHTIDTSLLDR